MGCCYGLAIMFPLTEEIYDEMEKQNIAYELEWDEDEIFFETKKDRENASEILKDYIVK